MLSEFNIVLLISWLRQSEYTVVFTGAGMSTGSGIPDFRSKDGWWRKIDPREVASVEALEENYPLFHQFYRMRIKELDMRSPHDGHRILARWEKQGIIHSIATQNVDGFHTRAGNKRVLELHGTIQQIRCHRCEESFAISQFMAKESCKKCGGELRPNVVLFGEMLPTHTWNQAMEDIQKSELVLIIGTSLQVYPVNQLPRMARGKTVYINDSVMETGGRSFDLVIKGKAKEVLQTIDQRLQQQTN